MYKPIQEILNKQLLRQKPTTEQFSAFLEALRNLQDSLTADEGEEHNKTYIRDFLRDAFYKDTNLVNTAGSIDCAIYQTKEASSSIDVILEVKSPSNHSEFPTQHNLNCKAMQELVLYFMRERFQEKNITLKHLVMTNGYEWFFIDASEFEKYFAQDKGFVKTYKEYANKETLFSATQNFYAEIAKPQIDKVKNNITFTIIDIRLATTDNKRLQLYRLLQPAHLLKQIRFVDSNKLNTAFYNELLHIIGLEEHKKDNRNVIERKPATRRDTYSLLESTIYQLDDIDSEDKKFDVALNLVITWINRVLFLKLLESQLINYQGRKQADKYRFLDIHTVKNYDELNELFFKVLAVPVEKRHPDIKDKFKNVPYLNSSLFESTQNEVQYLRIRGLKPGEIPLLSQTVLKDINGHKIAPQMDTLEYLFRFLEAYDFGSEQSDDITKAENKTLINASVLGLIFEKINGYKDGSFFTPAFITQYMCREAIERSVVQKFNEYYGWHCATIEEISDQEYEKTEATAILDSITLCDPAVGSGHFLVSALNRFIAIRAELGLIYDADGKKIKKSDYTISIDNDELIIYDEEGELFHYNPNNPESQRVQKTLFELKRRIIENNLFGVDVNPNSVNICRLRLWIELLKNAYYKDSQELETLPNIDINIKCGDSLKNKYPVIVGESINDLFLQKYVAEYKQAVIDYKRISDKAQKQAVKNSIEQIKSRIQNVDSQLNMFDASINRLIEQETTLSHSLEWMLEYPEVLDEVGKFVGFDIVIGNPPYIQLQADGGKLAKLYEPNTSKKGDSRNNYKTYARTGDIYCLFYERGYQLLKPNGILCFITSNKWMRAGYGEKTREFFSTHTTPTILIDFADIRVFENATVNTNILLVSKTIDAQRKCIVVSCQGCKLDDLKDLSGFVQSHSSNCSFRGSESWVILSSIEKSIKEKIESIGTPLREWDINIYRGVLTGYNDAFIIDTNKREELLAACQTEEERQRTSEIIRPILRGRDIKRYGYEWAELWLIYIPWHFPLQNDASIQGASEKAEQTFKEQYPTIYSHLLLYKPQLSERNKAETGIRYEWYAMQRWGANYSDDFNKPKIVWIELSNEAKFTICEDLVPLNTVFFITGEKIYNILGMLNAQITKWYFTHCLGTTSGVGTNRWLKYTIEQIPLIYDLSGDFEDLVKAMLSNPTKETETKIDSTLYHAYNLSEKEIAFVESLAQ